MPFGCKQFIEKTPANAVFTVWAKQVQTLCAGIMFAILLNNNPAVTQLSDHPNTNSMKNIYTKIFIHFFAFGLLIYLPAGVNAELGTTFVAYSPLGRAFLTGAVSPTDLSDGDFRKNNPRFSEEADAANRPLVDSLHRFATARNMTNAQVALAWLLHKHSHVVPIPGTRRIHYLAQNVAATTFSLSVEEIAELDGLFAPGRVTGERYQQAGMLGIE